LALGVGGEVGASEAPRIPRNGCPRPPIRPPLFHCRAGRPGGRLRAMAHLEWDRSYQLAVQTLGVALACFAFARGQQGAGPMNWRVLALLGAGAVLLALALSFSAHSIIRHPGSKSRRLWTGLAVVAAVVVLTLVGVRYYYDLTDLGQGILIGVGGTLLLIGIGSYFRPFIEIRPVSGANPQALLEIVNRGRTGEFYAGARVLAVRMESGGAEDFQNLMLRPSWLSSGKSDAIHLERNEAAALVLATSTRTPWTAPEVPRGAAWFRVKLQDANDRGEVFSWLTEEMIEIRIRVTVTRKKTAMELRKSRSYVRDFVITGHPDRDLSIASARPPAP
jgi:hypothetical protein